MHEASSSSSCVGSSLSFDFFLLSLFLFCIKKPERVFPYWNFVIKIFSPSCVGFFLGIVSLQHAGDTLVMWDSRCVYR